MTVVTLINGAIVRIAVELMIRDITTTEADVQMTMVRVLIMTMSNTSDAKLHH